MAAATSTAPRACPTESAVRASTPTNDSSSATASGSCSTMSAATPSKIVFSRSSGRSPAGVDREARLLDRLAHAGEGLGSSRHLEGRAVTRDVFGAALRRGEHQLVLVGAGGIDDDDRLPFELPRHSTGAAEVAVVLRERVTN